MDKQKANEFYYKNIWQSSCLTRAYLDNSLNFTTRRTAFYIGTYDGDISCDDFYDEVLRRIEEHKQDYLIGAPIPSGLGKYTAQMRKTVKDWES
jgi:hypothetical protein